MKKILRYIILCLPLVFLMSHNTFAANYSVNVNRFCYTRSSEYFSRRWGNNGAVGTTLSLDGYNNWYYLYLTGNMYSGCTAPQRGDIIQVNFTLANMTENNSLDAYVWSFDDDYNGANKVWEFIDYDFAMLDSSTSYLKLFYSYSGQGDPTVGLDITSVGSRIGTIFTGETIIFNNITMYRPVAATDVSGIEDAIGGVSEAIESLENSINNINQDEADATQDAADAAQDAADSSTSSAESATTGLINVIGGFVSAITNATPSNCIINGKINNSFDMGNLDLCAMPAPPFIQIIGSLILISVCIPFCIIMFNRFIGLFRSFQG